ncbi:MAG: pyridoxamine 5'-phosphate oxidase family protein [Alphaproteobacteria bacterium]
MKETPETPFHAGELLVQQAAGMRDKVAAMGKRMIRDFMPDEHRSFFAQLSYLFVGSLDADGRPWASILTGRPGFVSAPEAARLRVGALPQHGDMLAENLRPAAPVAILGIELHTRRRNRMNGMAYPQAHGLGFDVLVDQSFGNCPQYIQARLPRPRAAARDVVAGIDTLRGSALSPPIRPLIEAADTFFIASAYGADATDPRHGVDVSHRGGKPGFVQVLDERRLVFPDYRGNFLFNTLGNIAVNAKAGLLFVDFATGDVLQMTGAAEIVPDASGLPKLRADSSIGAQRFVVFRPRAWVLRRAVVPFDWQFQGQSPNLDRWQPG